MFLRTAICCIRRKHFVATPYDMIDTPVPQVMSVEKLIRSVSDDAKVPADWKSLTDEEVQRALRVLPSYVDGCKERYIQLRRLSTYYDLRRAAGHRARVRLHQKLDNLGDEGTRKWGRAHLFPAEP